MILGHAHGLGHKLGKWIAESRMSENSHAVDTRITRIGLQDAAWIDSTD